MSFAGAKPDQHDSSTTFVTAKQLLISRGADASVSAFTNPVDSHDNRNSEESYPLVAPNISNKDSKCKTSHLRKNVPKSQSSRRRCDRKIPATEEEAGSTKTNTQKSENASKDKGKKLYQPLNITKSVMLQSKNPDGSTSGISETGFLSSSNYFGSIDLYTLFFFVCIFSLSHHCHLRFSCCP